MKKRKRSILNNSSSSVEVVPPAMHLISCVNRILEYEQKCSRALEEMARKEKEQTKLTKVTESTLSRIKRVAPSCAKVTTWKEATHELLYQLEAKNEENTQLSKKLIECVRTQKKLKMNASKNRDGGDGIDGMSSSQPDALRVRENNNHHNNNTVSAPIGFEDFLKMRKQKKKKLLSPRSHKPTLLVENSKPPTKISSNNIKKQSSSSSSFQFYGSFLY